MPNDASILARIVELEASGASAALVTVVRASGSTPRSAGARMIVHGDGRIEGTVGGGQVEATAQRVAAEVLEDGRPRFVEAELTQQLGMCCGGQVALFVERIDPAPRLLLFGAGHVGAALSRMAAAAGFVVHVADERDELLDPARLPEARSLHLDLADPALPFGEDAYVMIATHDHALDQRLVERALGRPHRWLGVIGSRRKAELTRQRLAHKGFPPDRIARLRAPVGLAIGAETAEEIAVSILAELIAVRRAAPLADAALETKRPAPRRTTEDEAP